MSTAGRDLLRKLDATLASLDDGRPLTNEQLLSALRVLTGVVRTFVDYDNGLGGAVSNEQMRKAYNTLLNESQRQGELPSPTTKPGEDPTIEQQTIISLSIQFHSMAMLMYGVLARTGIMRDIRPVTESKGSSS